MRARGPLALLAAFVFSAALDGTRADEIVRLNQATAQQLMAIGFTESQAKQILGYRKENGDFLQVEELLAVPQISRDTFDKVRAHVTVDE